MCIAFYTKLRIFYCSLFIKSLQSAEFSAENTNLKGVDRISTLKISLEDILTLLNSLTLLKTCGKIYKDLIVVRQYYINYILNSCYMCPRFFYILSIYFKYDTMFFYFISLKVCE